MADKMKVGTVVRVKEKDLVGKVAYVGLTEFAAGKWIGIELQEPKGKNNGTVQGKSYFQCEDKYGMFVRQTQVVIIGDDGEEERPSSRASTTSTASSTKGQIPSPRTEKAVAGSSLKASATPTRLASPRTGIPKPGGASSKLPTFGKGPTSSRSPSFTNLKGQKKEPGGNAAAQSVALKKERSFVEKDFQQTVSSPAPTFSTPTSSVSPMNVSASSTPSKAMADRIEEKVAAAQAQQELLASKDTIKDLEEKLETLKVKRAKDQEKMKDFEKLKIQHEQLMEFKSRIMESQAHLQKELQMAKHEARDAVEAKEKHADEMADLAETVEMATLDKEMAEEKAEALQIELESAKEKIEELTLDLGIIKEEMGEVGGGSTEGSVTHFEVKQQMAQNEKLKDTIVKMRDLLAHEKNENMKLTKEMEEKSSSNSELSKNNAKLTEENEKLEATIGDLQEQVDAALGAEEMVENLTTKCLDMEDKMAALLEEKEDLEKLHDLNEELQENAREEEMQMREDLDLANAKIREMTKARDVAYEIIGDHEKTIKNFRDYAKRLQEENHDLRASLEKETNKPISTPAETLMFKERFEESKAHSKAIDMELRLCEERQAKQHVRYLSSYMSESFMIRGGDNEAILVLLLIPRMIWKADILISQIKEKYMTSITIDRESLLKGHDVERVTFGSIMLHYLETLQSQLHQFSSALSTCSPETFLRVGTLFPEMSVHERSVDFYIDLLRKNQLDENVPIDNLERGLNYFQHIYPLHLSGEKLDHPSFLRSHLSALSSAFESLALEVQIGNVLLAEGQENSEIGTLLKTSDGELAMLKQMTKAMKRRLPQDNSDLLVQYPSSTAMKFTDTLKQMTPLVKALFAFGKSSAQQAGLMGEPRLAATKLSELLHQAIDKVYEFNDMGIDVLKTSLAKTLVTVTELNKNYLEGEWDIDTLPAKPPQPITLRAETFKAEIKEAESLKHKLEKKDTDIKEMKILLRTKGEEMSEMQIRKDKAEKKLLDATRDTEMMREKLQRKVDDLQVLLKKKEKDFETTMDHLQNEIDHLEGEKGELLKKVKDITKQTIFKEINKNVIASNTALTSGPGSIGPSIATPVKDSPMLMQKLQEMQLALNTLSEKNYNREAEAMQRKLARMKPIVVPKSSLKLLAKNKAAEKSDQTKEEEVCDIVSLMKRADMLETELNKTLIAPKVIDLKRKTSASEMAAQALHLKNKRKELERMAEQLQLDVARLRASKTLGGEVESDFVKFPSPSFGKASLEKDLSLVGRVRLPCSDINLPKTNPMIVSHSELKVIHQKVVG